MVMTQRGQGRDGGSAQSWVKLGEAPRPSWRFEEGFLGEVRLEREELAREERVKEWWAEGPCGLRPGGNREHMKLREQVQFICLE